MLPFISLTCISPKSLFHCQNFNPFSSFCRFSFGSSFFYSFCFVENLLTALFEIIYICYFNIFSVNNNTKKQNHHHPSLMFHFCYLNVHISFSDSRYYRDNCTNCTWIVKLYLQLNRHKTGKKFPIHIHFRPKQCSKWENKFEEKSVWNEKMHVLFNS